MKLPYFLPLIGLSAFTFTACDQAAEVAETPIPAPPVEQVTKEPELEKSDEEIEEELLGLLGESSPMSSTFQGIENLPEDQQKTMRDALAIALKDVDMTVLLSALQGEMGSGSWNLGGAGEIKVLTPEEAEKMGLDLKSLEGQLPEGLFEGLSEGAITSSVQVMTLEPGQDISEATAQIQEQLTAPGGNLQIDGADVKTKTIEIEATPVEIQTEGNDTKIQEFLEAGDTQGLAKEFSRQIQSGVDQAGLQIGLGGTAKEGE